MNHPQSESFHYIGLHTDAENTRFLARRFGDLIEHLAGEHMTFALEALITDARNWEKVRRHIRDRFILMIDFQSSKSLYDGGPGLTEYWLEEDAEADVAERGGIFAVPPETTQHLYAMSIYMIELNDRSVVKRVGWIPLSDSRANWSSTKPYPSTVTRVSRNDET